MKFDYTEYRGAREERIFRPMLRIQCLKDEKEVMVMAQIDSGADYSIFPRRIAVELGIELSEMETLRLCAVENNILRFYAPITPVKIRIKWRGFRPIIWETQVLFGNNENIALLGYKGFFEYFNIHLNSKDKKIGIRA